MNPSHEDPNNHVPDLSPDDDWDELDAEPLFNSQLPPRRTEPAKAAKKNLNFKEIKISESSRLKKTKEARSNTPVKQDRRRFIKKSNDLGNLGDSDSVKPSQNVKQFESSLVMDIRANRSSVPEDQKIGIREEDFQALSDLITAPTPEGQEETDREMARIQSQRFFNGEREDWGENKVKNPVNWMLYSALGMVVLIALTIFLSQLSSDEPLRDSEKSSFSKMEPIQIASNETDEGIEILVQLNKSKKEAARIYAIYARAKSVDEFSNLIFQKQSNEPLARLNWKPIGASEDWTPSGSLGWNSYEQDGEPYAILEGIGHDFFKFRAVFRYEGSVLKIDWKATAGYGSASFKDLKNGLGNSSEIRVLIKPSDFYTTAFPEGEFHSYLVMSPDERTTLWCFTKIGTDVDEQLRKIFRAGRITGEYKNDARVVISLIRGAEESSSDQWLIYQLVSLNWLDKLNL